MKKITIEDFDKAVPEVAAEITMEHESEFMGAVLFSTSGIMFASALRKKLFEQQEEEKKEDK